MAMSSASFRTPCCVLLVAVSLLSPVFTTENDLFSDDDIPVIQGHAKITIPVDQHDVILLDKSIFNHVINTNDVLLVEFYAPWCGHCQSLEPEYAKAAQLLKPDFKLAKVDATQQEELAKEYGVTGFPTLTLFVKGVKIEEYNGAREAHAIAQYVREKGDPNWKPPPSDVVDLSTENFSDFVKNHKLSLIEFYAPWCSHCKKIKPELDDAAKQLKEDGIFVGKIDGTQEKALADEYGVKAWPTLFVFRSGRAFEFKGTRNSEGIVSYMRDMQKLPSAEVRSVKQLKNSIPRLASTIVGVFDSNGDSIKQEFFSASFVAKGEGLETKFLHSSSPDVAKSLGLEMNQIVVLKPELLGSEFEEKQHKLDAKTSEEIMEAVRTKATPLVHIRTKRNTGQQFSKRPLVVVYFDVNYSHEYVADSERVRQVVARVAKDFTGEVQFAVSGESEFAEELKALGLDDSGEDVNVGYWDEDGVKFAMEPTDSFEEEVLRKFVENVRAGKIKPFLRSQAEPKSQPGPVKILIASSFEKELASGKDYLIEFYAPWCGHCKQLEPTYKQLAENNASNKNLVVAKFDGTQNDIPKGFKVDGYPMVYFVRAGERDSPIKYAMKDRTLDAFQKFVNEHSSFSVKEEL